MEKLSVHKFLDFFLDIFVFVVDKVVNGIMEGTAIGCEITLSTIIPVKQQGEFAFILSDIPKIQHGIVSFAILCIINAPGSRCAACGAVLAA